MDDIKIIDLFFARSELAIEALDGKYGATCHNLSRSILKDQQDAEECVNDAYLGVWNAIPPHRPNPLSVFVCMPHPVPGRYNGYHGRRPHIPVPDTFLPSGPSSPAAFHLSSTPAPGTVSADSG